MQTEQTNDRTFRVTVAPDGQTGVTVFVGGRASLVLWLGSDHVAAAQRLAHHLETQIDCISAGPQPAAGPDGRRDHERAPQRQS